MLHQLNSFHFLVEIFIVDFQKIPIYYHYKSVPAKEGKEWDEAIMYRRAIPLLAWFDGREEDC